MFPNGVIYDIYDPQKSGPKGELRLHAPASQKILYSLIRGVGAGLIGFVIIAFLFTFTPAIKEEISYSLGDKKIDYSPSQVDLINANNTSLIQEEAMKFGVNSYFSIVIPKIGAKENIIANVNAANEAEYDEALMKGVAHAQGTYFPGQNKNIFLFAHSTNGTWNIARFNAVFYLLDKLKKGDEIIIYFADKRYIYKVEDSKIVPANDTSMFTDDGEGEKLILQTCFPPGTSWNRLLVIGKPIN